MTKEERRLAPSIYFLRDWASDLVAKEDFSVDSFMEYTDISYENCGKKDGNLKLLSKDDNKAGYLHMPNFWMLFDDEDEIDEDHIKLFLIGSFIFTNRKRYDEKIMWIDSLLNEKHLDYKFTEEEIIKLVQEKGKMFGLTVGKKRVRKTRPQKKVAVKFDYELFVEMFDCVLENMDDDNDEFEEL